MMRLQILLCVAIGFAFGFVLGVAAVNAAPLEPLAPALDPLKEYRQCGAPKRDAKGVIARRADVIAAYKRIHPCPSTGKSTGACPAWAIDHIIPLASGGCDAVSNLAWMPLKLKTCPGICIDRWEREYYGNPHGIVKLP